MSFSGTARFRSPAYLGAGGMGVVYRVHDAEIGTEVALKTLRVWEADQVYRLKREFRVLADIRHPNLIELHELFASHAECFFTMEFVPGVPFTTWVRDAHDPRFNAALVQLVEAIICVHGAGKLHRDIKPSNVLVTSKGRVVVLDFGLATAFGTGGTRDTIAGTFAGTPQYMAPEQAWGEEVGPPADWYALGTMIYEMATGRPPFLGSAPAVLTAKRERAPARPRSLSPGVPVHLDELVMALLDPDPSRRPAGHEILQAIDRGAHAIRAPRRLPRADDGPFVGRAAEIAALHRHYENAWRGGSRVVLIRGASGIGKTTLIRHFLTKIERGGALVLRGRCHPRETVPYRGFDTIIDELSRFLIARSDVELARLLPRHAAALTKIFPVLARVPMLGSPTDGDAEGVEAEPHEVRRRAFTALREMMARLADRQRLVLWIDDAQWSGADGGALVRELLREPDAPVVMVIASHRGAALPPFLAYAADDGESGGRAGIAEMVLGPLEAEEVRSLVQAFAGDVPLDADAVAAEAAGSPFLATELARAAAGVPKVVGPIGWDALVRERLHTLGPDARHVIELVSVAAGPIERSVVLRAANLGGAGRLLLAALHQERVLQILGSEERLAVETYHDRVREAVTAMLDPSTLVDRHRALARAYEETGAHEVERLAYHCFGAGEGERASGYAVAAAEQAETALAFEHAARFYRLAREWWPGTRARARELCVKEAEAKVNAGHCGAAAHLFINAADDIGGVHGCELRRRAAEQFLAAGHFDDGVRILRPLLDELGLSYPASARSAVTRTLTHLAWLSVRGTRFRPRPPGTVPAEDLVRADACYSAAKSLAITDPARGVYFALRGLTLALSLGEPVRVGRSLLFVGGSVLAVAGGLARRWGLRLMAQAGALTTGEKDPYLLGFTAASMGTVHVVAGEWRKALEAADEGVQTLTQHCRGVSFECAMGRMAAMRALEELGRFEEVDRRAEEMLAGARSAGDRYGEVTALLYAASARLASGHVDRARTLTREAMQRWSQHGFHIQHLYATRIETFADLYEGRPERARARVLAMWPALEASSLLRVPVARVDAYLMRWRAASALGCRDARLRGECVMLRRRLARESRPDARAHALLATATLSAMKGARDVAMRQLEEAATSYRDADMILHAACAARRQAELASRSADHEETASADRIIRACGVRDPERWVNVYAPGLPPSIDRGMNPR